MKTTPRLLKTVVIGILAIMTIALSPHAKAQSQNSLSPEARAEIFTEANSRFDQAVALLDDNFPRAHSLLQDAIARYQRLVDDDGASGMLFFNLGNAQLLAGDTGRAILNLNRAHLTRPYDENISRRLAQARARRLDDIPMAPRSRAIETVLFWHYDFSPHARWWIFTIAFNVLCLLGAARLLGLIRTSLSWPLAGSVLIAALFAGSLAWDYFTNPHADEAVIVVEEIEGRQGPDDAGYSQSFSAPLHAGAEVQILEDRGAWARVRLSDDRETWLPVSAIERVTLRQARD